MTARKVLYSPGFGAGWSTWADSHKQELATDAKLVELVEAGKVLVPGHTQIIDTERVHPEFRARVIEICGDGHEPYYGGLCDLKVKTVNGPFRIDEYDGSESIVEASEETWW